MVNKKIVVECDVKLRHYDNVDATLVSIFGLKFTPIGEAVSTWDMGGQGVALKLRPKYEGSKMLKTSRIAALFAGLLVLAGCRVEVFDQLSQRDANQMTALLLTAGIDAERVTHKDGTFAVSVAESQFAEAVILMEQNGLPKPKFATMTDVLSDDRLIASPTQERARLNYGLSQELSRTVSDIDGVVIARVHLATPNDEPLSRRESEPATASVALHHRPDLDTDRVAPQIKMLVANAVDGLDEDKVLIALFETSDAAPFAVDGASPSSGKGKVAVRTTLSDSTNWDAKGVQKPVVKQNVTPAGMGGFGVTPLIAAILTGGLLVLLLAGHALFRREKKPYLNEDRGQRHRARR